MPKIKRDKSVRLTHPSSRKAYQMSRLQHKSGKKNVKIHDHATKLSVTAKKFLWFKENLDPEIEEYDACNIVKLVERYTSRFDAELEQIGIIQSIGHRRPTQHTARERAIKMSKEHEDMLLRSNGLEIPDLLCPQTVRSILDWDGDAKSIPKFKVMKYTNKTFNKTSRENT